MKVTRLQRLILKELFKARGKLDSYTLYRRYYITPSQLAASIKKFIEIGDIKESDGVLTLTPDGKRRLVKNGAVTVTKEKVPWKEIPEEFVQAKIPSWLPYAPEIDLLDKSLRPE